MKVWLSGSRGFIGSAFYSKSLSTNLDIVCFSNQKLNSEEHLFYLDFGDREQIFDAVSRFGIPDTFVHLGWGNVYSPHHTDHIGRNLSEAINLVETLYDAGLERFISVGSSSEYGDLTGPLRECSEISPLNLNNYVKGKTILANRGFEIANRLNRRFIHVRLFYTYGSGQRADSLISQLYNSFISGEELSLSPCLHYRDYIYLDDVIRGLFKLLKVDFTGFVNLGSGHAIMLKTFVEKLWIEFGGDPKSLQFGQHSLPTTEQPQPIAFADLTRLRDFTSWIPEINLELGIKMTASNLIKGN